MKIKRVIPPSLALLAALAGLTWSVLPVGDRPTSASSSAGPQHEWLAADAGTWDVKARIWQPGRTEPFETKGESRMTMLWKRYLREEFRIGEGAFVMRGIGLIGFDVGSKAFQSVYCLNTGSAISVSEGRRSAGGKVLTLSGADGDIERRCMITRESEDRRRVEYFVKKAGGKESKKFEMLYTRRK